MVPLVFEAGGHKRAWHLRGHLVGRAAAMAKAEGAEGLLVLNASPFHLNKHAERLAVIRQHVSRHKIPAFSAIWLAVRMNWS